MDFDWSDEQLAMRESMIKFATRELGNAKSGAEPFTREVWQRCADVGIQGLAIPEELGGQGASALTTIVALEALGYSCADNGLLFSLNAHMWAVQHPILEFGSPEQQRRYLPGLCSGALVGAHAMSEPGSGSDAFALTTAAVRDGDSFRITGTKTFTTNAPVADLLLVFATLDRGRGMLGLCAFLVERDTRGLEVGPAIRKMGLNSSPMSEVFLDDCRVPAAALLGRAGRGAAVFNAAMERERSLILACTIGTMERTLDESVAYARQREQFGRHIGSFQTVSNRLVDMKLRLETARLLLYRLGWLIDQGRPSVLDAALVKLHLGESLVASSLDAVRTLGGYGYTSEYGVEGTLRDAIGSLLYSGTSDIQRNLAARQMGL